jgi:hypothetical protein
MTLTYLIVGGLMLIMGVLANKAHTKPPHTQQRRKYVPKTSDSKQKASGGSSL